MKSAAHERICAVMRALQTLRAGAWLAAEAIDHLVLDTAK
jgi:hypothetical protein